MEKLKYTIYQVTNLINSKFYVGMHQTKNLKDGYMGSGKYLRRAISKYGIENFKKEILWLCDSFEEMKEFEKGIITEEFLEQNKENTYNLLVGGKGGFYYVNKEGLQLDNFYKNLDKEEILLHRQNGGYASSNRSKVVITRISDKVKNYYKTHNGTFKGKKHTEEAKQKMKRNNIHNRNKIT